MGVKATVQRSELSVLNKIMELNGIGHQPPLSLINPRSFDHMHMCVEPLRVNAWFELLSMYILYIEYNSLYTYIFEAIQ